MVWSEWLHVPNSEFLRTGFLWSVGTYNTPKDIKWSRAAKSPQSVLLNLLRNCVCCYSRPDTKNIIFKCSSIGYLCCYARNNMTFFIKLFINTSFTKKINVVFGCFLLILPSLNWESEGGNAPLEAKQAC